MPRPTRLTKKVKERILHGIRIGLPYDRAAQLAGIHPSTFYLWKKKGAEGTVKLYIEFLDELKKAEVEGEVKALEKIIAAADEGTWQAAAWLLERRFPKRWSKIQKLEVSWRDEFIGLIRQGVITPTEVIEELGDELSRELFESAGISVIQT